MHELSPATLHDGTDSAAWLRVLQALDDDRPLTEPHSTPLERIFAPLLGSRESRITIVGQLGQSLDGRIATVTGHSHYVNGFQARVHLHRLRAWADAVVVGVGTILSDDPELSVRHVPGPSPTRVVIDPRGRMPCNCRVLRRDGVERIILRASAAAANDDTTADAEVVVLPLERGGFSPSEIVHMLIERGHKRILVEGGANTLSRFLAERALDRLHIAVAPVLIGSGLSGLDLPVIQTLDEALRPGVRAFAFDDGDTLFDCALRTSCP